MIPTRYDTSAGRLVRAWFDGYCRYALGRHFHAVKGTGRLLTPAEANGRLVVAASHSSFWDGIVLNWLLKRAGWSRRYCLIDAREVRRHPFFRYVGGFGVELGDPRDGGRAVRYATGLLRKTSAAGPAALTVFPQGRIVHADAPLDVAGGVGIVARRAGAAAQAVALRYEFVEEQYPEALVHVADPVPAEALTASLGEACQALRRSAVAGDARTLPVWLPGRRSVKRWTLPVDRETLRGRGGAPLDQRTSTRSTSPVVRQ